MTHWPSCRNFWIWSGSLDWGGGGEAEERLQWPVTPQVVPAPICVSLPQKSIYKQGITGYSTNVPFLDESCGCFAVPSMRSFPLLLEGGVIELPTSGQLSLSSTGGTDGCELRGLTTKASSFSGTRIWVPFAEGLERDGVAPSRNPELVLESRSCDATDGGGSFAEGMTGGLRVA